LPQGKQEKEKKNILFQFRPVHPSFYNPGIYSRVFLPMYRLGELADSGALFLPAFVLPA